MSEGVHHHHLAASLPLRVSFLLDEYACLWDGCEFLSMGSPAELEVHAYFHNYHSKLKFVGSQLLKSRSDLPSCNQGVHSNNLVPEGLDGYVCQWEQCDVGVGPQTTQGFKALWPLQNVLFSPLFRARSTIRSGSTGT